MKFTKYVMTGLAVVATMTLAACSSSEKTTEDTSLSKIEEKGTLVVALNPEFAPFEFKTLVDGKDTLVGADIELAKVIGEELGVEVEFSTMSFDNVLNSVQNGKADIAISGISATEERAKVYDFSVPYYTSTNKLIINKADIDEYTDLKSLATSTIGTQKGSIQEQIATEQFSKATILSLTSNGELINQLKSQKLDAVIFEEPIAKAYVAKNDDLMILDVEITSSYSDAYAIALPKGSTALKEKIDVVITELVESGKMDQLVQEAYYLSISQ
ncbi:TPA: transporter substrate-binding domain-containing protein [Streptococcus suis]|nr:transporter substrate-binding domain-containing protein [Streptococcus suis]